VILLTAMGDDDLGNTLRGLLADHVEVRSLPLDGNTVSKCRVAAGEVPLLRLDSGSGRACRGPLPPEAVRTLESAGAILVADYGRGVAGLPALRKALLQKISSVPVIWDPHSNGPTPVRGCWLITPNAAEAQLSSGAEQPAEQGRRLCAVACTRRRRHDRWTGRSRPSRPPDDECSAVDLVQPTAGRLTP
jgi:bifunctional ADP-heptose synthase (sugar kinase/adenylyltransferase)